MKVIARFNLFMPQATHYTRSDKVKLKDSYSWDNFEDREQEA